MFLSLVRTQLFWRRERARTLRAPKKIISVKNNDETREKKKKKVRGEGKWPSWGVSLVREE